MYIHYISFLVGAGCLWRHSALRTCMSQPVPTYIAPFRKHEARRLIIGHSSSSATVNNRQSRLGPSCKVVRRRVPVGFCDRRICIDSRHMYITHGRMHTWHGRPLGFVFPLPLPYTYLLRGPSASCKRFVAAWPLAWAATWILPPVRYQRPALPSGRTGRYGRAAMCTDLFCKRLCYFSHRSQM